MADAFQGLVWMPSYCEKERFCGLGCWRRDGADAWRVPDPLSNARLQKVGMAQQQPQYSQPPTENSWELISKAAAVAAAAAPGAYNGYGGGGTQLYHRSLTANGNHRNANNGDDGCHQWHGIRLPTAPSPAAGGVDAWLAAGERTPHQQNSTGITAGAARMLAPASTAPAATQLYSGNAPSCFGSARSSLNSSGHSATSPTSPRNWPPGAADLLKTPPQHPAAAQDQESGCLAPHIPLYGLHEKLSPRFNARHSPGFGMSNQAGAASPAPSYENLLEAAAIHAAVQQMPTFSAQQQPAFGAAPQTPLAVRPLQHHLQSHAYPAVSRNSSLLDIDILRNLAASAGNNGDLSIPHVQPRLTAPAFLPTNGYDGEAQHQQQIAFRSANFGSSNADGAFRIKEEPLCNETQLPATPTAVTTPTVIPVNGKSNGNGGNDSNNDRNNNGGTPELDIAKTMLTIQTCSLQSVVPEYQQISPADENSEKSRSFKARQQSEGARQWEKTDKERNDMTSQPAAPAITVETDAQDETECKPSPPKRSNGTHSGASSPREAGGCAARTEQENGGNDLHRKTGNLSGSAAQESVPTKLLEDSRPPDEHLEIDCSDDAMTGEHSMGSPSPMLVDCDEMSNDQHSQMNGRDGGDCSSMVSGASSRGSPSFEARMLDDCTEDSSPHEDVNGSVSSDLKAAVNALTAGVSNPSTPSTSFMPHLPTTLSSPASFSSAFSSAYANQPNVHKCQICGFSSPSKFHFNSHMNTHADHKCDFCDYTSRTEGRLKRHMKEFHSPQGSTNGSNDDSSGMAGNDDEERAHSLEQQLQAVVASMTTSSLSGCGVGGTNGGGGGSAASARHHAATSNKPKTYKCKQCEFVARSKDDFWAHSRAHIKSDKLLSCPKCQFVTEYKHHLEYHLRNHFGSKPFKCVKCNYSCVNKSMLNSHMKSHSNFYQYRCADCTYATKYCHSLKLHLRKYSHTSTTAIPDIMLDGSPTETYGKRRGPRHKKSGGATSSSRSNNSAAIPKVSSSSAMLPLAVSPALLVATTDQGLVRTTTNGNALPTISACQQINAIETVPLSSSPPAAPFTIMEALQLAQQSKDVTAMVSSIATLGAQLPTVSSFQPIMAAPPQTLPPSTATPPITSANISPTFVTSHALQAMQATPGANGTLKCNLCDFSCTSKEMLTKHTMLHMVEKPEQLYQMYSLMVAAAAQSQVQAAAAAVAAAAAAVTTQPNSFSGGNSPPDKTHKPDLTTPSSGIVGELHNVYAAAVGATSPVDASGGRFSPSHETFHESVSPASVSGGKTSGDEGSGNDLLVCSTTPGGPGHRQRRKGRAFKLDRIALKLQGKSVGGEADSQDDEPMRDVADVGESNNSELRDSSTTRLTTRNTRSTSPVGVSTPVTDHRTNRSESVSSMSGGRSFRTLSNNCSESPRQQCQQNTTVTSPFGRPTNIDWSNAYVCNYCEIAFKDCIMYTMHMGYHGYQDPYKCNTCGHVSEDPRAMFLHIAREPHL